MSQYLDLATLNPNTEMPNLKGALQEYERHFSGIWGHFPECCIFHHKSTKCTHTRLASISPYTVPSQMHN